MLPIYAQMTSRDAPGPKSKKAPALGALVS